MREINPSNRPARHLTYLPRSALRPPDVVHQLFDLPTLLSLVARRDRMLDAVPDVIAQDFLFQTPQCSADRRDLRDDVDAVAVVLDHARDSADLAFDPIEPFRARCLDVLSHVQYIPPYGIGCKSVLVV
jgi:hypothetical protein